jgi:hypothetical protein
MVIGVSSSLLVFDDVPFDRDRLAPQEAGMERRQVPEEANRGIPGTAPAMRLLQEIEMRVDGFDDG